MKKFVSFLLVFTIILLQSYNVFAAYRHPLQELIDVELFDKEGSEYTRKAYQTWLDQALPEVLAHKILDGNFAFVPDCKNFWNIDKKDVMPKEAKWINDKINIPAETVEKLFGVNFSTPYVAVDEIVKKVSKYKLFTDPRGFALITQDISVIDKKPAIENNVGGRHYRSYYDVSMCIAEITWEDKTATSDDFKLLRKKIADGCTFDDDINDADFLNAEIESTKKSMALFNKSGTAPIFAENDSITVMFHYYQVLYQWGRTHYMLKKLGRNDVDLNELKEDFIILLKYLYDNNFGCNSPVDSNWYMNRISYPSFVGTALTCMYDELPKEDVVKYANTMLVRAGDNLVGVYCVPFKYYTNGSTVDPVNAYSNYSNLLWQTYVNFVLCCLTEDSVRANHTIKVSKQAFENVKNGEDVSVGLLKDGVYEDGSFVFHAWYAYNLGYGKSYACTLADLVQVTSNSPFDIKNCYGFNNVYKWIEKSWLPFIHKNWLVHIVQGRENPTNLGAQANSIVIAIMILALESGNQEIIDDTAKALKPIIQDSMQNYRNLSRLPNFSNLTYPNAKKRIEKYLDYIESLDEVEETEYSNVYYNMDKVVHKGSGYKFMLSMASNRIDRYEAINAEGYTDWYESDGMTYTLCDDNQYVGEWWNYVDRYKLPGITVDEEERNPKYSSYGTVMPNNTWAGAATNGKITVASSQLTGNAADRTKKLEAWKSWFMLDDKIVCLGTGITGGTNTVSTVVENVLLNKQPNENNKVEGYNYGYEDTVIDGKLLDVKYDNQDKFENPKWAWIEPNRGFLFLNNNNVIAERVAKDKKFAGLSLDGKNNDITKPFMTLWIDHGQEVKNASYAYVILPNVSKEQTETAAENLDFEVISQTNQLHAVRYNKTGAVLASIIEPCEVMGFKFMMPCCAIIEPLQDGNYKIYVSDPSQTQHTINVIVPDNKGVLGDYVINYENKKVEIKVDNFYGRTYDFTYGVDAGESSQNKSPNIITNDISLKCGKGIISTNLCAFDVNGKTISYKIVKNAQTGKALLKDGRLYYIPNVFVENYVDDINVEAKNTDGESSTFTISVQSK